MAHAIAEGAPIGAFATTSGDGAVRVGIRPEQLLLREDADGDAVIAEREFRGHDVLYKLHHAGLGSLVVQLPSVELFTPGQRVRVVPHERAVAAVLEG